MADFFFPPRCPVCDSVMRSGQKVCMGCRDVLVKVAEPKCRHCGKPILEEREEYCQDCRKQSTSTYIEGRALWLYDRQAGRSLARFKYNGRREYAAYYAEMLAQNMGDFLAGCNADALVPVPIHKKRMRKRGYNQAEELARELEKRIGIPVLADLLERRKDTEAQKDLDVYGRRKNLAQAFFAKAVDKELCNVPSCVILIDDIYTTGSTVEACAGALRQAGVEKVYYVSLCIGGV